YTVLQRDAESNRELYLTLLRREKELQVLANSRGNNVRIVERAMIPRAPVRGNQDRPVLSGSSDFSEAIRALRTSLALSHRSTGSAIVVVTSAQPLEGKTTTACNLALALAYGGARVLLVDADMRRPGVHTGLGLDNTRGLSDLLG